MKIKKGDNVIIIAGKDRGKTGTVVKALPQKDKVIVGGINLLKVHQKPRKSGEKGQIVDRAMPLHVSNVRLSDTKKETKKEKKAPTAKKTAAPKEVKAPKVAKVAKKAAAK